DTGRTKSQPEWLPLAVAIFATLIILTVAYNLAIQRTGGVMIYALDDAYIHLSMARNLRLHGVWGIEANTPASASSSPLWTSLLSVLQLIPIDPLVIPLLLNLLLAMAFVVLVFRMAPFLTAWQRTGVAILLLFGLPGVAVYLSGMENLLHACLTLLFM